MDNIDKDILNLFNSLPRSSYPLYYKQDGTAYESTPDDPEGTMQWAKDFENFEERSIAQTKLANGFHVSTVWMGLNHEHCPDRPPLIFETMVFDENDESMDMNRYSTKEQAIKGHYKMVGKWLKKGENKNGTSENGKSED